MLKDFLIQKTEDAQDLPLPARMSEYASGLDLYANVLHSVYIEPKERLLVSAGIKIALPPGYEAQVRPRSGLALKHGITMVNGPGTIDADYRGEIHVLLINHGNEKFLLNRGDRIAQMVVCKVEIINFVESNDLPASIRGEGGFGHSGV